MKRHILLLSGLIVSTTINAKVIQDVGWDTYSPIPKVAEDTQIDDDSSGKSTSGGLIIVKPDASKLNNTNKEIDCDSDRFKKLCNDLGVDIAAAERNAKAYSNYMVSDLSQNLNGKIQSARAEARNYSNLVKNQAFARTDKAKSEANSYADLLHSKSVTYTNDKYNQAISHANWARNDARAYADERANWARNDARNYANGRANEAQANATNYAEWARNNARNYANDRANEAQRNSYGYTDRKFAQLNSDSNANLVPSVYKIEEKSETLDYYVRWWSKTPMYRQYEREPTCNGKRKNQTGVFANHVKTTPIDDHYDEFYYRLVHYRCL